MSTILIVEDDVAFCSMLETFLQKKGYQITVTYNAESAFKEISENNFNIVLTDIRLPDMDGIAILDEVISRGLPTQVILMTSYAEINKAVDAIKKGAFDYISKPVTPGTLLQTIEAALSNTEEKNKKRTHHPSVEVNSANEAANPGSFIKGVSDASLKLDDYIKLVAPTDMSVLITGESGTGKEYVAKSIHDFSKRKNGPFIPVDCGAIPKEIASSEFFGHVKGSFTGAINNKTGHFEAANGGTLFLDEIGNLNYELQVQLLRALQERKIKPVGSNKEVLVDIRVLAATNEELERAVENGTFREDLYHRLNEFSIRLPRLEDRKEDIVLFADHFLEMANIQLDKKVIGLDTEVVKVFQNYHWPGNLREMQNCIKRGVLLSKGDFITVLDIPSEIQTKPILEDPFSLYNKNKEMERIMDALQKSDGNKSKAARLLNIDRKTLYNKLHQYDINL